MSTVRECFRAGLAVAACFGLSACSDDAEHAIGPAALRDFELAGLTVAVDLQPPGFAVRGPGKEDLLRTVSASDLGGSLAFRAGKASYEFKYGAFRIEAEDPGPWQPVDRFERLRSEGLAVAFDLVDKGGAKLADGRIRGEKGGIAIDLEAPGNVNRAVVALACRPGEHFLGLGGQSFDVDHRGQIVPLWVQEDGITKYDHDAHTGNFLVGYRHSTHTPMPIFLSSAGYALAVDTSAFARFSFCAAGQDEVRLEVWERKLRLRIFAAPDLLGTLERLTAWTGRPRLPPAFTFAPWLDAIYGSANVRRVAKKLRDEGVPASVIWTEDWRGASGDAANYVLDEDWNLDEKLYPDFTALAGELHAAGFKFQTYNNTFLSESADVYKEALAKGYSIHDPAGKPYLFTGVKMEPASLLDLSNPAAVEWARGLWKKGLEQGADGWMADYAEWLPADAVLHSGKSAEIEHNLYPVAFQKLTLEVLDEMTAKDKVERLCFVRSGWLGSQPLVQVMWAGDQQTDFTIGDGMASVIPMGIGLGITGFPFFAHDIAGYQSLFTEPSTRELFLRWTSFGALSPVMRTHHGRSAGDNWNWEKDAETTAHFRFWASLHIRLFPYLFSLAGEAVARGLPLMRPLALHWPDFEPGWTRTDQYLLGDRIAVAPIIEPGATKRTVWLPPGRWYPLLGGPALEVGSAPVEVKAGLTEIPAFVPAGALLVLLPESVRTLAPVEDKAIGLEAAGDDREIRLWPGGASSLVEQGGLSYTWQASELQATPTSGKWNGKAVTPKGGVWEIEGTGRLELGVGVLEVKGGGVKRKLRVVVGSDVGF